MSQTPMKINAMASLLQGVGLNINPTAVSFMGSSSSNSNYTPGTIITATALNFITSSIRLAYTKIGQGLTLADYNKIRSIGSTTIPALGNSTPSTFTETAGAINSHGFLRQIALQANTELTASYPVFCQTFNTCYGIKSQLNETITAMKDSLTYLDGVYSNMDDLITSDIAGVSMSTFYWGQDLVASGRAIDLSTIGTFGEPVNLLRTLNKNRAITSSLNLVLLSAGLNDTIVTSLLNGTPPTADQHKLLYGVFCMIQGDDLVDVLIPLNCQTPKLDTLADLLNPKKLFPNSYTSLTFPKYNGISLPTNSKTYYLMYEGNQPNVISSAGLGERLRNIIPFELAYVCDALSTSMLQIKNITSIDIEKFSQVVMNLENVSDLEFVNGTSIPGNTVLIQGGLPLIALGSSEDGTYSMCDFFGAMTNLHYLWKSLQELILSVQTSGLAGTYSSLYSTLGIISPAYTPQQVAAAIDPLIDSANAQIASILSSNSAAALALNTLYNTFGTLLTKEKAARTLALPSISNIVANQSDIISFMSSITSYAQETKIKGAALVIEQISNISTMGGNNLIGALRETRNEIRLGLAGAVLDNKVGEVNQELPRPTGKTLLQLPITGYIASENFANIPIVTGAATTPGSFGGSSQSALVPDNLSILVQPSSQSVLTPNEAVSGVILCNCDCWDLLE